MDVDQSARANAQEYFGVKDPDYYEFEGNKIWYLFKEIKWYIYLTYFVW